MGEYERVYNIIESLEQEKRFIKVRIQELQEKIAAYEERLYEVNVEIGECEGYLDELRSIDGEDYQYGKSISTH